MQELLDIHNDLRQQIANGKVPGQPAGPGLKDLVSCLKLRFTHLYEHMLAFVQTLLGPMLTRNAALALWNFKGFRCRYGLRS